MDRSVVRVHSSVTLVCRGQRLGVGDEVSRWDTCDSRTREGLKQRRVESLLTNPQHRGRDVCNVPHRSNRNASKGVKLL